MDADAGAVAVAEIARAGGGGGWGSGGGGAESGASSSKGTDAQDETIPCSRWAMIRLDAQCGRRGGWVTFAFWPAAKECRESNFKLFFRSNY